MLAVVEASIHIQNLFLRVSLVVRHKFIHESYDIQTPSFPHIRSPTFGLLDTA